MGSGRGWELAGRYPQFTGRQALAASNRLRGLPMQYQRSHTPMLFCLDYTLQGRGASKGA